MNSEDSNAKTMQELFRTKEQIDDLILGLEVDGKSNEAETLNIKSEELQVQLDRLIIKKMDDWGADIGQLNSTLGQNNLTLKESIKDIQNGVKAAENIVKVVGLVDSAISIAKGIA